jgi:hypothetical protein
MSWHDPTREGDDEAAKDRADAAALATTRDKH